MAEPLSQTAERALPAEPSPRRLAGAIRVLTMDAVERAKSGHVGMPMGMADVAVALFGMSLLFDPDAPEWPDRDRLVLSAGHGSMLLYSVLHLTGYPGFNAETLRGFRTIDSLAAGHPEIDVAHGIEMTTGPLGQGLASAVGMALAERMLNARVGDDLVDHRTYVLCSDGDLMEGISHEAASLAGHLQLARLIVLYDDNGITIDGATDLSFSEDSTGRFEAYGWRVETVNGHDPGAVAAALARARKADRPSLIRCRTTIAFGAPNKAGDASTHAGAIGAAEIAAARVELDWPYPPFEIPADVALAWRGFAAAGRDSRAAWNTRLEAADPVHRAAFEAAMQTELPRDLAGIVAEYKRAVVKQKGARATRAYSGEVLERLTAAIPGMIGGSGDLTPANNTQTASTAAVSAADYSGRYIHYGAREHAMAGLMNGLALHGGFIPYGGSFLVFTDYARPSIRLAALMKQRVVHVMTHDSVALGEDGPTHQPIEHLSSLRAIPGVYVFRPADAVETAECWELALRHLDGPSVISLSRQEAPLVRAAGDANLSARGGYVLAEAEGPRSVTIFATGTEVAMALEARRRLQDDDIGTRVVSMPCIELFELQDAAYQDEILAASDAFAAVEAAARHGWDRYIGRNGVFVGMAGFGASAPAPVVFARFGITVDAMLGAIKARLKSAAGRDGRKSTMPLRTLASSAAT